MTIGKTAGLLSAAVLGISAFGALAEEQVLSTAGFDALDAPSAPTAYDVPIGSGAVTEYLPLGLIGLMAVLGAFDDDGGGEGGGPEADGGDVRLDRGGLRDRPLPDNRVPGLDNDADAMTVTATSSTR